MGVGEVGGTAWGGGFHWGERATEDAREGGVEVAEEAAGER